MPDHSLHGYKRLLRPKRFLVDTSIRIHNRHHDDITLNQAAHFPIFQASTLVHALNKRVDLVLAVTEVTALDIVQKFPGAEATSRVGKLEWPEEVCGLLEVRTAREDFVDEVLHADDAVLSKALLDDGVIGEGNALGEAGASCLDLAVSTLVDKLADGL